MAAKKNTRKARTPAHPDVPVTADVGAPNPEAGVQPAPGRVGAAHAVWAALTGNPGASTAVIADAARVSRSAAAKALAALESAGQATRTAGNRDGGQRTRDIWHAATAATADAEADPPSDVTGTAPDAVTSEEPAADDHSSLNADTAADPMEPSSELANPDATDGDEGIPDAPDNSMVSPPAGTIDEGTAEPDPAMAEACRALIALAETVGLAAQALCAGNTVSAVERLEAAYADSAKVRRQVKAAINRPVSSGGRAHTRPGELRALVAEHLAAYPESEFTPYEIARALGGRSSGAVAVSLDSLTRDGTAMLTCERPRRYSYVEV